MLFDITFYGRNKNAIGIFYEINAQRKGVNFHAARLALYNEFEHITVISYSIVGGPVGRVENALYLLPDLDMGEDFHALNSATVEQLNAVAKTVGYRAPKNRNGSAARYFHAYLQRGAK